MDKDGKIAWFVPVLIGAAVGAYTGASIQSGTANFTNWDKDAWKGAIVGGIVGAGVGTLVASGIGASGITTSAGTTASKGWGFTTSVINNANLNIGLSVASKNDSVDELWKSGVAGAASGAYSVSGGFGLIEGFGTNSKALQFGSRLAYQASATTLSSIGNNWAAGSDLFSNLTVGVGPVNLTVRGGNLLQLENNVGNIVFNGLGIGNAILSAGISKVGFKYSLKGSIGFDWENLAFKYQGGLLNSAKGWTRAYAILGDRFPTGKDLGHELNHVLQSRALNNNFVPLWGLSGLNSVLYGWSFNYFNSHGRTINYIEQRAGF